MKHLRILAGALLVAPWFCAAAAPAQNPLCASLRTFASSVAPGQTRSFEFHTVWGGDFKSDKARTLYEKQCIDHGYKPAKAVCKALMQQGAVEFSGNNAKATVSCLSPTTHFPTAMRVAALDVLFSFGTPDRGSNIAVSYGPATKVRGMVLVVTAAGY